MARTLKVRRNPEVSERSLLRDAQFLVRSAEEPDVDAKGLVAAIKSGRFDAYLVEIDDAVNERVTAYEETHGDITVKEATEPAEKPVEPPVRKLREPDKDLLIATGLGYALRGEKFSGVRVVVTDKDVPDKPGYCRIVVEVGNKEVPQGRTFKVPHVALLELPNEKTNASLLEKSTYPVRKPYGYASCKRCGASISYSGKGRPQSHCDMCKSDQKNSRGVRN